MGKSIINKSISVLTVLFLTAGLFTACGDNKIEDYNTENSTFDVIIVEDTKETTEAATIEASCGTVMDDIEFKGSGYDGNSAFNYNKQNYVFIKTLDEVDAETIKEYEYLGMVDKFAPGSFTPQEEFTANFLGEAFPIYDYGESAREIVAYYKGTYNLFVRYESVTGGVVEIRYDEPFYFITCLEEMSVEKAKEYTYLGEVNRVVSPAELLMKPFSTNLRWIDFPIYQYNNDCTEIIAVYDGKVYLFASSKLYRDESYREKYGVVMC